MPISNNRKNAACDDVFYKFVVAGGLFAFPRRSHLENKQTDSAYVQEDVEHFREEWLRCRRKDQEQSIRDGQKRLKQAKKRLDDLARLIQRPSFFPFLLIFFRTWNII